jgi:hypothetical protein
MIHDADGSPVNSKKDVDAIGRGYKELREGISLAHDRSLPFSFAIDLPEEAVVEDDYEFVLAAEPAEPARSDLDIPYDDFDASNWPASFYVRGAYENPGADLSAYAAIVVTLYDMEEQVIGVGWLYEADDAAYLTTGEHEFEVEVEMWEIAEKLELTVATYRVQIFGD